MLTLGKAGQSIWEFSLYFCNFCVNIQLFQNTKLKHTHTHTAINIPQFLSWDLYPSAYDRYMASGESKFNQDKLSS